MDSFAMEGFSPIKSSFELPTEGNDGYLHIRYEQFKDIVQNIIDDIYVDEPWYIETYPDVSVAISDGTIETAKQHFVRYGIFEGRKPRDTTADWQLDARPFRIIGTCMCRAPGEALTRSRFGGIPYYDIARARRARHLGGLALIFYMGIGDYLMATPVIEELRLAHPDLPIHAYASTSADMTNSPRLIHLLERNPSITATFTYEGKPAQNWKNYDFRDALKDIPADFLILPVIYDTDPEIWHRVTAVTETFSLPVKLPVAPPIVRPSPMSRPARTLLRDVRQKASIKTTDRPRRSQTRHIQSRGPKGGNQEATKRIVCCHFDARSSGYVYPFGDIVIRRLLKAGYFVISFSPTGEVDADLVQVDVSRLTPNDTIDFLRELKSDGFNLNIISVNSLMWGISACLDIPNLGIHFFWDGSIHQYLYPNIQVITHHAYTRVSPSQLFLVTSDRYFTERSSPSGAALADYDPELVMDCFSKMIEKQMDRS
jgi:hypothetical protein